VCGQPRCVDAARSHRVPISIAAIESTAHSADEAIHTEIFSKYSRAEKWGAETKAPEAN
jgi:hypothetical protein